MLDILIAAAITLNGGISNSTGRIGILVSKEGYIFKVHRRSPAKNAGLKKDDVVLSADGEKGSRGIEGPVGTKVNLIIKKKNGSIEKLEITRVNKEEIND